MSDWWTPESKGETCIHAWEKLVIWIGVTFGTQRMADMAFCSKCGESWELTALEVAAATALLDGHLVTQRAKVSRA